MKTMKKLSPLMLIPVAALAFATVGFACQKDKAAKLAAAEAGGVEAVQASAKTGGCAHAEKAVLAGAEKAGCAHAEKAGLAGSEKTGCPHAQKAALEGSEKEAGCHGEKASKTQRAALEKGEAVTLVGQVLCASCDLKIADGCRSVFKTETGAMYALIGDEATEKLRAETRHGEKRVEVTGTAAKDGEESILQLSGFKILS